MQNPIGHKLTEFFQQHLPLTQFMGLTVEDYDGQQLILTAPLEPNINDKQTAFGGSLYNATVMACWGLVYLKTQEAGISCNQVVTQGDISYIAPVTGKLWVCCEAPDEQAFAAFFESYERKGRARIELSSKVSCDGQPLLPDARPGARFTGQYAILKN